MRSLRSTSSRASLIVLVGLLVVVGGVLAIVRPSLPSASDGAAAGGASANATPGLRRKTVIDSAVVQSDPATSAAIGSVTANGWTTQVGLGYRAGDRWEPAIAADRSGHVYVLYAHYLGVPGCPDCANPTQVLQVSNDRGATWGAPRVIQNVREQGWDSQIVVDPVGGKTVYAAWIERYKSDVIVAKSTDFGKTWTYAVANKINKGADKPILTVRGQHVYVAYNHATQTYVSSSHDGGKTFSETKINPNANFGWALAAGGTVTPNGVVHFSWNGYEQNGVAKGPVNLYISTSRDGGKSWSHKLIAVSGGPPDCSADLCGWAYLGAQIVVTSDAQGVLYALWNASTDVRSRDPNRVWFSKSTDGGRNWASKRQVSTARAGAEHTFPAIAARGNGDVRISWMDTRVQADNDLWNTYYRSSTNGGSTWSAEDDVSTPVPDVVYIRQKGFEYPFGDYYELDIDDEGTTQLVNGQGLNYDSPGGIWYTKGT